MSWLLSRKLPIWAVLAAEHGAASCLPTYLLKTPQPLPAAERPAARTTQLHADQSTLDASCVFAAAAAERQPP